MKFGRKAIQGATSCCLGARPGPLAAPVQEVEAGAWRKIKKKGGGGIHSSPLLGFYEK